MHVERGTIRRLCVQPVVFWQLCALTSTAYLLCGHTQGVLVNVDALHCPHID